MTTPDQRPLVDLRTNPEAGLIYIQPGYIPEHTAALGAVMLGFSRAQEYVARHRRPLTPLQLGGGAMVLPPVRNGLVDTEPVVKKDPGSGDVLLNVSAARLGILSLEGGLSELSESYALKKQLAEGVSTQELIEEQAIIEGDETPRVTIVSEVMSAIDRAGRLGSDEEVEAQIDSVHRSIRVLTRAIVALNPNPESVGN